MCIIKKEIEESNLTCSGLEGKEECEKCPCREEEATLSELKGE